MTGGHKGPPLRKAKGAFIDSMVEKKREKKRGQALKREIDLKRGQMNNLKKAINIYLVCKFMRFNAFAKTSENI